MAKTKNGHPSAEETLEKILEAVKTQTGKMETGFASVGARIDETNERIDTLATGTAAASARGETRLDEIARNTGSRQRHIETRLKAIEDRLGMQPPPQPQE